MCCTYTCLFSRKYKGCHEQPYYIKNNPGASIHNATANHLIPNVWCSNFPGKIILLTRPNDKKGVFKRSSRDQYFTLRNKINFVHNRYVKNLILIKHILLYSSAGKHNNSPLTVWPFTILHIRNRNRQELTIKVCNPQFRNWGCNETVNYCLYFPANSKYHSHLMKPQSRM